LQYNERTIAIYEKIEEKNAVKLSQTMIKYEQLQYIDVTIAIYEKNIREKFSKIFTDHDQIFKE
jgi:hypothetical protein